MLPRPLLLAAVLVLAPLTGCAAPTQDGAEVPEGPIEFETIDRGPNSGIEQRGEVVVRNFSALSTLWQEHKSNEGGDPGVPNVDFNESMVLAIFKGQSSNGCHGAEITNVTGDNDTVRVEGAYFEVTGQPCTEQITHPFHIVSVPRYDAPVTFDIAEETRPAEEGSDDGDAGGGNQTDDETSEPEPGPEGQGSYTCREPTNQTQASTGSNVSHERIERGSQSGIEEPCVTVARNETAWRDLWTAHQSNSGAPDERPEVNFTESIVVAIFKGQSPDGCHGAEIESVAENGTGLVVHGAFVKVEGAFCTEAITYPFDIVEVDRPEGSVTFDVEEETRQADHG